MTAQQARVILDGWKEIQACLEQLSGKERTRHVLRRWANRKVDRLPIFRNPGGRDVWAERSELEGWWRRHAYRY